MNKPQGVEIPTDKGAEQQSGASEKKPQGDKGITSFSIVAWMKRFRQLDWVDRLNLVLAAILGLALVLALSPMLLISWICLQLAKRTHPLRRPSPLRPDHRA